MIHLVIIHLVICLLAPAIRPATAPHVFADNYIDRSVSILIRDQTARIEFSVAMNDTTIRRLIQEWQSTSCMRETDSKKPDVNQTADAKQTADGLAKIPATDRSSGKVPPTAEEEFANDAKLVAEFRKLVAEKIAEGLLVTCQEQAITIREVNPDLPPKHHMSATVQFEFTLPAEKVVDLSVVDSNFAEFDGGARYALKVGGSLVLARSNVAPILVRADRIEFAGLSQAARKQAGKIKAQIVQTRQP